MRVVRRPVRDGVGAGDRSLREVEQAGGKLAALAAVGIAEEHERDGVRAQAAMLGGAITREAGPVKGGSTVIAFITDPDGYKIELIQRGS